MNVVAVAGANEWTSSVARVAHVLTTLADLVKRTVHPRLTFLAYRSLARFSEVLPERAIAPLSTGAAAVVSRLARSQRAVLAENLTHVYGRAPESGEIRDSYASYIRYWLQSMRLPVVDGERLDEMFSFEGIEHIQAAREAGKGCILALPHLGNWDVAGTWFVRKLGSLTVVVEELEPQELFVWFKDFRESLGVKVVVNGPSVSRELASALRRNESLALLCDRDVDGTGMDVEMFGARTKLPKGPATLALRTGAALIPVAVYERNGGYHAVVQPAVPTYREGSLRVDVTRVTRDLTVALEDLIRCAPTQWHVFQPNWPREQAG